LKEDEAKNFLERISRNDETKKATLKLVYNVQLTKSHSGAERYISEVTA
jgi:hypothetical protein